MQNKLKGKKNKLVSSLSKNKIETRVHYIPNHLHSYYKNNKNVEFNVKI